ncbi:MAG: hypothetical protein IPP71_07230 [Bacteroidetes bacterium]|nr:hypothetical protein [Bacteroidota bacterium]
MQNNSEKSRAIPVPISEYIKQNFREDYLTEIKLVKDSKGIGFYYVDVTHEDNIYHLKFNESGDLMQNEIESVSYPEDEIEIGNVD